jgi:uncharacterized phage protein gp47/JayE
MTENYDRIENRRNIATLEREWDSALSFHPDSNTYTLLSALLSETDRVDADLEEIYNQQHIYSATGEDLEQWGDLARVERKTGEPDDKYRTRILAAFRASTTGTTFDQFVEFTSTVLATDHDNLDFETSYDPEPAVVQVTANSSIYDAVSLTATEIEDILGSGVPAGHAVNVIERGTFLLKQDGDTDTAENGLTSDSISTGGTLASDVTS